jgi:A118 family predicted phage portal protein
LFLPNGQELVSRVFALGTGAWALWLDIGAESRMLVRRYDARMVLPLTYDDDGVTECAFVTQATKAGRRIDQLQLHVKEDGTYRIRTLVWEDGRPAEFDDILPELDTRCGTPTFALVKPAIDNTCVDMTPYGMSIFHDALGAVQAVDVCFDSIYNEIDLSKMRIFIGDMLIDAQPDGKGGVQTIPFGDDDVIFRKITSNSDKLIETFAPPLRTEAQLAAYHAAWETLGDLTGFGIDYFTANSVREGVRTATEVASDNSQLMRSIHKHENALEASIVTIARAIVSCGQEFLDCPAGDPGTITVNFDDSIITDSGAEKAQDMLELDRTLNPWEYRVKWYGETEEEARANAPGGAVRYPDGFGA